MRKILFKSFIPFLIGILIFAFLILLNQLNQLAISSKSLLGNSGYLISWGIFAALGIYTFYPIVRMLTMPKVIKRPNELSSPEEKREFYFSHKNRILKEYSRKNSHLKDIISLESIEDLKEANSIQAIRKVLGGIEGKMDKEADSLAKSYATAIFTATALSQNGSLDAIFVLKLQLEMIWKIARVYNQKPKMKDLFYLYTGVFSSALASAGISEIPVEEIANTFINSSLKGMPIISSIGSKIIDGVFEGTCNALLCLRVGYISKGYSKISEDLDEKSIRKGSRMKALNTIKEINYKEAIINLVKRDKNDA
jgi:hypothetical protein